MASSAAVAASSSLPAKKRKASNASQISAGNSSSNSAGIVGAAAASASVDGGGPISSQPQEREEPRPSLPAPSLPRDGTAPDAPPAGSATNLAAAGGGGAALAAGARSAEETAAGSSHPSSASSATAAAANRGAAAPTEEDEEEGGRRRARAQDSGGAAKEAEAPGPVAANKAPPPSYAVDKPQAQTHTQLPPFKKRRGSSHDSSAAVGLSSRSLRSGGSTGSRELGRRKPSLGGGGPDPAFADASDAATANEAAAASAIADRKASDADRSLESSAASSGQRLLLEAMMMTTMAAAASGDTVVGEPLLAAGRPASGLAGPPSSAVGSRPAAAAASTASNASASAATTVAGHAAAAAAAALHLTASTSRERLESWSGPLPGGGGRDRLESWGAFLADHPRDRLESWGGMSDLSLPHVPGGSGSGALGAAVAGGAAAAGAAGGGGSASAALGSLEDDAKPPAKPVPSRISLHHDAVQRDRINSVASLSEVSVSLPVLFDLDVLAGVGGAAGGAAGIGGASVGSIGFGVAPGDLQAYVAAAVASVGDQLVELAEAVESAAAGADDVLGLLRPGHDSETSSIASPLIGAVSDGARHGQRRARGASLSSSVSGGGRPRAWSTGSGRLSVDFEAVQAAIDAGHAAAGSLDIAPADCPSAAAPGRSEARESPKAKACRATSRRKLPIVRRDGTGKPTTPTSSASNRKRKNATKEAEETGERARAAEGLKLSSARAKSDGYKKAPPLKKRAKRNSPDDTASQFDVAAQTPIVSNRGVLSAPDDAAVPPLILSSGDAADSSRKDAPANKKWEVMYDALVDYAKERKEIETKGMSADDTSRWTWDGHVPTNYKTEDGKPLGRWVNNQRSAKGKGTLKDDRADRLVAAGLKWTEQRSTGWSTMFEELKIYIEGQTKLGKTWDGNVPTGYQIKARPGANFQGEDKNLGRWVNRQRSMFQAGRLQKDRQIELENLGLKWSMIQTVSWDDMYDALVAYADEQKAKSGGKWDGNVPAGYRTTGEPSRALGRWINRQRSAYAKNRLKDEYKEKLSSLGLKWSHREGNQRYTTSDPADDEIDVVEEDDRKNIISAAV